MAEKKDNSKWLILITVMVGTFLGRLDQTVVNLALPKIINDFSITVSSAGWIATAYIITNAVFVPVFVPDPKDSVPALVIASAERAMALDSTLADAQIADARRHALRHHVPEAIRAYRRAIASEPSVRRVTRTESEAESSRVSPRRCRRAKSLKAGFGMPRSAIIPKPP